MWVGVRQQRREGVSLHSRSETSVYFTSRVHRSVKWWTATQRAHPAPAETGQDKTQPRARCSPCQCTAAPPALLRDSKSGNLMKVLLLLITLFTSSVAALHRQSVSCRRHFLVASATSMLLPKGTPGVADSGGRTGSSSAVVTSKVQLKFVEQVSAEESRVLPIVIGLFGNDAPKATSVFAQLCAGNLQVPCPASIDLSNEVMERERHWCLL